MEIIPMLQSSMTQFAPHGYCFLWSPTLLWGMVTADLLIAASYYSIPIALATYAYKRKENDLNHLLWKFSLFILLCGTTHLVYLWNIWNANYYLEMIVKLLTGVVSFFVAYNMWVILPKALKIPSVQQLRKLNKELADSETRYRTLFENANEGVWLLDTQGNTQLANEAIAKMLGTSLDELQSSSIFNFVTENEKQVLYKKIQQRLDGIKERYEHQFIRKDGTIINTFISTTPTKNANGEIDGILKFVSDLTEKNAMVNNLEKLNQELETRVLKRTTELKSVNDQLIKQVEQTENSLKEQRESKARLDAVFNASPVGIIITDKRGYITDANIAIESMFGYRKTELMSQHVNVLTPPDFRTEHQQYIDKADESLTTKKLGFGRKLTAARRYNVHFPVDVALTKIAHSEKHYYMAVIRDLTEIDKAENELLAANEKLLKTISTMEEQSEETRLLNEYTEMLQSCQSYNEYPNIVNAYCNSIFNSSQVNIYTVEGEDKLVSLSREEGSQFSTHDCWALKSNKPYPINTRQQQISCKHIDPKSNTVCVPLTAKGKFLGLITLTFDKNSLPIEQFFKDFEQTLQAFSVRTSICMANLKLLKEIEIRSFKDELTGLYNRRYMNESLRSYLPRAKREDVPVTVLMIDIDYFKNLNDNYGHNLGDAALVQVAHCIEQCLRDTDLVCRMGGEEFLVVMYDANEEDGERKANNIHAAIATINNLPIPVTVSIGVAQSGKNDDAETLIRNADLALYDAKENGRNQTQLFTLHNNHSLLQTADKGQNSEQRKET